MLFVAIIIALVLIYLLNFREAPKTPQPMLSKKRVGGAFAYNDMFDISQDELSINTVGGPGGGSLIKKYV